MGKKNISTDKVMEDIYNLRKSNFKSFSVRRTRGGNFAVDGIVYDDSIKVIAFTDSAESAHMIRTALFNYFDITDPEVYLF